MRVPYEYALIRVVPSVPRGEFLNVGVLLFCEARSVLRASIELDEGRLTALHPGVDLALVRRHLAGFECVCRGDADAGPVGELPPRERWRWLTAPRNTILQTSPAHGGVADDLDALVEHILACAVRCPA